MAVLGLRFCARALSSCGKWGPLFIAVRGPPTLAVSLCCGAQAPDAQAQQLWLTGPAAPRHVGSPQTRARTRVPRIGRQTLNHCATRKAPLRKSLKGELEEWLHQVCVSTDRCGFGMAQVRAVLDYRKRDQLAECGCDLSEWEEKRPKVSACLKFLWSPTPLCRCRQAECIFSSSRRFVVQDCLSVFSEKSLRMIPDGTPTLSNFEPHCAS